MIEDEAKRFTRFQVGPGGVDFETMRAFLANSFRWELAADVAAGDFRARWLFLLRDGKTYGASDMSASRIIRDRAVLARGDGDGILVQVYLSTGYRAVAGRKAVEVRAGDVALFDLSRPLTIEAAAVSNVAMTLPRAIVAPLVRSLDGADGCVYPARSRAGRLLAHHVRALSVPDGLTEEEDPEAHIAASAALVAACLGPSEEGLVPARAAIRATLISMIRGHIERHVGDPELGLEALQKTFGLSRSTLYRLFEPAGGVERVIARRRLADVRRLLVDPGGVEFSIGDLARRAGYASPSSFTRAFGRAFGATPRELRRAARSS